MPRAKTRRVRALEEAVYRLLLEARCAATSEVSRLFNLPHASAILILNSLWRAGRARKHVVGQVGVWCVEGADALEVYAAAFRSFGYDLRVILRRLAEVLESAKSRRLCVNSKTVSLSGNARVSDLFSRFMRDAFGGDVLRTGAIRRNGVVVKHKHVYTCVDVDEARDRVRSLLERAPPKRQLTPPPITEVDSDMTVVSFHLPRSMLEAIDALVASGVYKTRSHVVREAVGMLLAAI
jgi:hypothetical protein